MRPNILFITADQWRGDSLGAAGATHVRTPNVDRLAADGVTFRRHFAGAAPCSPARAVLYTGLYQQNNRVCTNGTPLDDRFDNVARAARRAGYDPTLFGYSDTSADPRVRPPADPALTTYEGVLPGFTVRQSLPEHEKPWLSWLKSRGRDVPASPAVHRPADPSAPEVSPAPPVYDADETQTAFLANEFIRWLGEQDRGRPWFAHVSLLRPHPPFIVPAPYNTMYDPAAVPRSAGPQDPGVAARLHPWMAYLLGKARKSSFLPGASGLLADWSEAERLAIKSIYLGMITEVDAQIGRIAGALADSGVLDDTLVIVTSDHAELMGDHCCFGKGGFLDGGYHIPLVVRPPKGRFARGAVIDRFTEAADLFPTLSEMMGVEPAHVPDGRSLLPFLKGAEPAGWRDHAFWEFDFRDMEAGSSQAHFGLPASLLNLSVIRTDAAKYVHFAALPPLLFDLEKDPGETVDRSGDPACRDLRLELAERLLTHRARHLDQTLAAFALTDAGAVRGDVR